MFGNSGVVTNDARTFIEELAQRKGTFTDAFRREAEEEANNGRRGMLQAIRSGDEAREDLVKLLRIISTDLYTNRARFLMEVLQNADDSKYSRGETPTLFITISPNHVKIECNEKGFSREDIEALCRTGRSSKTPGRGYTGEKGIGFKSVFKLAERAHIRSPPYYFQLDQTRELGMITPIWDESFFDDHAEEHQTTIVLDRMKKSGTYVASIKNTNFAFAYLPLGNFGFKFVIQADFLTTSNRQSVDEDNHWNKNIAEAIPCAFESAIRKFNGGDPDLAELAKQWPLYLDNNTSGLSPYWRGITESINQHLHRASIIRDRTGSYRKPELLMFLDWAHDGNGEPMFGQMCEYVSPDYPESVREALLSLGVSAPNWLWLCGKLQELHDNGLLVNKMQRKEWCSDLAKVILKVRDMDHESCIRDLRNIQLIPLANGTWECPFSEHEPIYFPSSSGLTIPPGLPLSLVDKEACDCPERRKLFRLLGVKDCDVANVIERIVTYHTTFESAIPVHIIAQLKYLYRKQEYLRSGDMEKVYFVCSSSDDFLIGSSVYADTSIGGELNQHFSGYSEAHFLDDDYFAALDYPRRKELATWLSDTADVALAPRFIAASCTGLHEDFQWLLRTKSNQILAILHQYWNFYEDNITEAAKVTLASHEFLSKSGRLAPLDKTYIPLPTLVQKAKAFGDADDCNFLSLPSTDPKEWTFLSVFGVGLDDDLDFYLWVLNQSGFNNHTDVGKSQQLYLEIQSRIFSPADENKAKRAFGNELVNLPDDKYELLRSCVWNGPKGFTSKPALCPVYGHGLDRLFREILQVPNATCAEALEHLKTLRNDTSTVMAEVVDVYVFLQMHHATTLNENTRCIALPASSGSALEWKTPAQCVWDDDEFSQNGLELVSKTAVRSIIEHYAPTTKEFFTNILRLPNAGIYELLEDLALMQEAEHDIPEQVYQLYERVQTYRRSCPEAIVHRPLVFLRGTNDRSSQWVSIKDCIWTRSVLQDKHALKPSLKRYRDLFQETLGVQDATVTTLVTELLESAMYVKDNSKYQHVKDLWLEIADMRPDGAMLDQLDGKSCWPCRTPTRLRAIYSVGSFYINDRQDLFDAFSNTHTFLDFNLDVSRKLAKILQDRGCDSFLSKKVVTKIEPHDPLEQDIGLAQDFRGRADALVQPLLENVEVWMSQDISTLHTLEGTTVTQSDGGCSVEVSRRGDKTPRLVIYVSANEVVRSCALITDFPQQVVEALALKPNNLPHLQAILQVQRGSLKTLLIKRGISGGNAADEYEDWQIQSNGSSGVNGEHAWTTSAHGNGSGCARSAAMEPTRVSATSRTEDRTQRSSVHHQLEFRPAPKPQSQIHPHRPADGGRRRAGLIPTRNEDEVDRDFNIGFLGEKFVSALGAIIGAPGQVRRSLLFEVYNLLLDTLKLPDFTAEVNWTSSLRCRAGFSPFDREVSDFTYSDTQGVLTSHFLQMKHPCATPNWLSTVRDNSNVPLYRLEVKSTTSQEPGAVFFMSDDQYKLAKKLRVTSPMPSEVYVILRIWGLGPLEDGAKRLPQWSVYLDPYNLGEEGILHFDTPSGYAVTVESQFQQKRSSGRINMKGCI
ncbi:hypothetical protein VCV18_012325 [Metarhizium anisopliae]